MSDIRIIKTRQNIEKAFVSLLNEKSFKLITINDICKRALTSRSTFYLHYLDKYDLLNQLFDQQLSVFSTIVEKRFSGLISGQFEETVVQFYDELVTRQPVIQALFQIDSTEYNLKQKFEMILYENWLAYLNEKTDVSYKELTAQIGASIVFDTLNWSFVNGVDHDALNFVEDIRKKVLTMP
ncbi:TetR/AcrR family transcriptional regulator [Leuconostoc pseudomesenteroides]|uniref:TetR family transcriptional regulator n=1 Tax=Leuconostoc pseudomesenteroides TaxID=33968 RepID=UPI00403DEEC4